MGPFQFWSFSRVETSGGIRASLAGRYASALFDLARDQRKIDAVSRSLDALSSALVDSKEFAELVASPLVSRDEAGKAFAALAPKLGIDEITTNFLGVLAANGRKNELRNVVRAFNRLAADHRGEITAEVITAHFMTLSERVWRRRGRAGLRSAAISRRYGKWKKCSYVISGLPGGEP